MTLPALRHAHVRAWLFLCLHLAAHIAEEAALGFIDVWNPVLAQLRQASGIPLPHLAFGPWLGILVVLVLTLLALAPLVARGVPWLTPASYVFGAAMIVNGVNHLVSPAYLGRFLPGAYTSPLLIVSAGWLIVQARRAAGIETRVSPALGTLAFFLAGPVIVLGWVPFALTGWQLAEAPLGGIIVTRFAGAALTVIGAGVLGECFIRFARRGRGTPAAFAPPERLVISGLYRYVRNPMYLGGLLALAGQALLFASLAVLEYAAIVWLVVHAVVVVHEEPALLQEFPEYAAYRAGVPRWIPRARPWEAPGVM
jgi:protein-S-isoprenylcysteine O-methyltransferase Ste14